MLPSGRPEFQDNNNNWFSVATIDDLNNITGNSETLLFIYRILKGIDEELKFYATDLNPKISVIQGIQRLFFDELNSRFILKNTRTNSKLGISLLNKNDSGFTLKISNYDEYNLSGNLTLNKSVGNTDYIFLEVLNDIFHFQKNITIPFSDKANNTDIQINPIDLSAPVGSMLMFAGTTEPIGWLICDGRLLNTTTYAKLFSAIGYSWGGSGSSFRLPDCRGGFPRGISGSSTTDPDRTSRYAKYSGGSTGNNVGSYQDSQFGSHTHSEGSAGYHSHSENSSGSHTHSEGSAGYHSHSENSSGSHTHSEGSAGYHSHYVNYDGTHRHSLNFQGYFNISDATGSRQARSRYPISSDPFEYIIPDTRVDWAGSHSHNLDTNGSHSHTIYSSGDHTHTINANGDHSHTIYSSGDHTHTINANGDHTHTINANGGNETRPTNFYVNYVIKY